MDSFTDHVAARQAAPDLVSASVTADFDLYCSLPAPADAYNFQEPGD